ncbi:transposase [Kitasatospora sp. NPDC059327]|uniref:transposase n=1 Tax=Kitasatospora sp. NPDC059327 TaxID=3346803 RepID=UPI0036B4FD63
MSPPGRSSSRPAAATGWRVTRGTAPDRIVSTVDPESRHVHKTRTRRQDGYKAHLAIEPETTIHTEVELTPGAGSEHHEAAVARELLAGEDRSVEAFGDTAYSTGTARQALGEAGHTPFFKPVTQRPAVAGGFVLDDFRIDGPGGTATCPAGRTVPLSPDRGPELARTANFGNRCTDCPLHERCTTSKTGKNLRIQPGCDLQRTARQQAADPAWQDAYRRWRPPVERAVARLVGNRNRRLRHRGTTKNNAWLHTRAAALNLRTPINLGLTHNGTTWQIRATA